MTRSCDSCGRSYMARRRSSRFCSARCRSRNAGRPPELFNALNNSSGTDPVAPSPLVESIQADLDAAGRLDTMRGQLALLLARRIGAPIQSGSSTAALSRELRAVMDDALTGATKAADPVGELAVRRERKLNW